MRVSPFIAFLLLFSFFGCKNETVKDHKVFLGGEIVNPTSPYFLLSKDGQVIDTLRLNRNNTFGKHLGGLQEGIYSFQHPPEHQIMYLEPGDSILIWLNTMAFDESINFSGRGARKSSFLHELFLKNEENNDLVLSYFKIHPEEFARLTDSIRDHRKKRLETLRNKNSFSEDFLQIARAGIHYEYYHLRERYAFLAKKYYPEQAEKISEDFHQYRKDLDFNNKGLASYYVYTNFIDDYLRTQALELCARKKGNPAEECFDLDNFENIRYRILLADSLIQEPGLKTRFVDRLASQAITFSDKPGQIEATLELLDSLDYQSNHHQALKEMAEIQTTLLPGEDIGELPLTNAKGDQILLKDISNRLMITYHWSMLSKDHFQWQQGIIQNLREKYPEINFIGINLDPDAERSWSTLVNTGDFAPDQEYQLTQTEVNQDLLHAYLNKLFFIDKDGKIVQGSSQLNSPSFEREILEFLNEER